MRRFKDVPICLRVQPEFNRCVRRRYRGRVRACVCERANCEEEGEEKKRFESFGERTELRKWVKRERWNHGMSVDEGSRQFCLNHDG